MKADTALTRSTPRDEWPSMLRVEEVAILADISRGLAYDAVRRGELPAVKFGRVLRVPKDALVAMLEGRG